MKNSIERIAMLADVGAAGGGAMAALAAEYGVTTRAVYGWLEAGFPARWDQDALETFRYRLIRLTGGGHLIRYWQTVAAGDGGDVCHEAVPREVADTVTGSAAVLARMTESLADGRLSLGERMDLVDGLRRLGREVGEALAAVEGAKEES